MSDEQIAEENTVKRNNRLTLKPEDTRKRQRAVLWHLENSSDLPRRQMAELVTAETGLPCSAMDISYIKHNGEALAKKLGVPFTRRDPPKQQKKGGRVPPKAPPRVPAAQQQLGLEVLSKSSLETDVERVRKHMLALDIQRLVIHRDGTILVTKEETFHVG